MDHSWMYDRVNPNRFGFKDSFLRGVGELVNKAMEQPQFLNHGEITRPCVNCKCIDLKMPSEMRNACFHIRFLINVLLLVSYANASLDVFTSLLLSLKGDLRYKMQRYFNG
ncbi:hypothetical protein QL285_089358 [Trifolium repens]|nr:hypothetical protein QL285_089358 [Trifolium repens]